MKKIVGRYFRYFLFGLVIVFFILALFINREFRTLPFEQLIFSLYNSEGTSIEAIKDGIFFVVGWSLFSGVLVYIVYRIKKKLEGKVYTSISIINKKISFDAINFIYKFGGYLIFTICLYGIVVNYGLLDYIESQFDNSLLFENYYVEPDNVEISFPKKKKNLIYIIMESMESSNFSKENGGLREKSYIPNLEKLALENTNFSVTENIGGAYEAALTGWTAASLIAQTSGIPLKLDIGGNDYYGFSNSLPGAVSIGDILEKNGYKNYFMLGSDASFGGRKDYFKNHGNYKIYDYNYAIKHEWIPEDYKVWWGYEDSKLFEFAKSELLNISKNSEPFNFTLLTADTHFMEGYIDNSCKSNPFDIHYANSYYCSDTLIYNFIKWIQKQDFYNDTVIVLVGDHKTMQSDIFDDVSQNNRYIYNTIINSDLRSGNFINRSFSLLDMYPTTLAALGVKIENDRLALGTNLYSDKNTYMEELGIDYFNNEINKKSNFYNKKLLSDTYFEINNKMIEEGEDS